MECQCTSKVVPLILVNCYINGELACNRMPERVTSEHTEHPGQTNKLDQV